MKLLSNGMKDYYDYMLGRNGIDTTLVFDRTKYMPLSNYDRIFRKESKAYFDDMEEYRKMFKSRYFQMHYYGRDREIKGKIYDVVVEIGFTQYLFQIDVYIENDIMKVDRVLLCVIEDCEKFSHEAIGILVTSFFKDGNYYKFNGRRPGTLAFDGVILKDTWIASEISAERVYRDLYEYFTKLKEPKIIDNRSDVQKLEAHGFDRKTSFRNIK